MWTFKNLVAAGFVVFGSTFLWMTRDFLADPREGTGIIWSIVQGLALLAVIGFATVAWAVFTGATWWEPVALVTAVTGLVALIAYVVGIFRIGDQADAGVQVNIAIHAVGIIAVFAVVLVPAVHEWMAKRV